MLITFETAALRFKTVTSKQFNRLIKLVFPIIGSEFVVFTMKFQIRFACFVSLAFEWDVGHLFSQEFLFGPSFSCIYLQYSLLFTLFKFLVKFDIVPWWYHLCFFLEVNRVSLLVAVLQTISKYCLGLLLFLGNFRFGFVRISGKSLIAKTILYSTDLFVFFEERETFSLNKKLV